MFFKFINTVWDGHCGYSSLKKKLVRHWPRLEDNTKVDHKNGLHGALFPMFKWTVESSSTRSNSPRKVRAVPQLRQINKYANSKTLQLM